MKAQKLLIIAGVAFAGWAIAQTVLRSTPGHDEYDPEVYKRFKTESSKTRDSNFWVDRLGKQLGIGWDAITTMIGEDADAFDQGVLSGGTQDRPGVIEELGNTGRLYTWLNGRPVLLPGSDGPAK